MAPAIPRSGWLPRPSTTEPCQRGKRRSSPPATRSSSPPPATTDGRTCSIAAVRPAFLKRLEATTLAFADYSGNRQYITQGHVSADDRVALFLIDYPARRRLKIYARAEVHTAEDAPDLVARVF